MKGLTENLPKIVMIHGYMSGSLQFCKMMGYLRPYYEVISIDLPGMGASGRPAGVTFRDFEDTISYFEERIKKWA